MPGEAARAEFLGGVPIFAGLAAEELERFLGAMRHRSLAGGEVLFREGDPGGELFVVESGTMGIAVSLDNGETLEIAAFGAGDFFGEMSIFEQEPRSATCYAKSPSSLLCLQGRELFRLMDSNPGGVSRVLRRMLAVTRRRLANTGDFLADMVQWGEDARRRAITDPLTGLYNRRYLDDALEEHVNRAREGGTPLAIVMLDLDRFREINEGYSQQVGDRVIVAAAEVFRRHLRATDVAARYGGDEFTFLLPNTEPAAARELLERIRRDVEALSLLRGMNGPVRAVTTSQGVACFPEDGADALELRQAADGALYRAKEDGRNRVVLASDRPGRAGAASGH